ncbi:MAG: hypothetical protein LUI87_05380 [Lachnospiraceae bacterium]|nr:hypothetical protein [Lachnospiraceae bacterium]
MKIRSVKGFFSDVRIDRNTVPDMFRFWELADGDSDGMPCRYRPGILVNFFGTFITTGDLPVDDEKSQSGYIELEDWTFIGSYSYPFRFVIDCISEKEVKQDEDLWLLPYFNRQTEH